MYKKVLPSHRPFKRFEERIVTGDIGLREVVRMGAQIMLQHAVELEMSAYLDRGYYENQPATTAARGRRPKAPYTLPNLPLQLLARP